MPWLQGVYLPSHLEILSGTVTVVLELHTGEIRDFSITAPPLSARSASGNEARAEFPTNGMIQEWWLRAADGPPAFFTLAWPTGTQFEAHQFDRLQSRLWDYD